jgi:FtsP/CotA-like multicopper oxidase with cupredoxin domain
MNMRLPCILVVFFVCAGISRTAASAAALPTIASNDNTHVAGTLDRSGLSVNLVARDGMWYPDGPGTLGAPVGAFGETGKAPMLPGPLLRVPAGTPVSVRLRNAFAHETLHVYGLSGERSGFVTLAPGALRTFAFVRKTPGTYAYWANDASESQRMRMSHDAGLAGAIVVDDTRQPHAKDHIFVLSVWDNVFHPDGSPNFRYELDAINGHAWPATERITYTRGKTVRWRIVNASLGEHPLHLHGFPFVVDDIGDGIRNVTLAGKPALREVTHLTEPGETFAMHWQAARSGLWLFHCHFTPHTVRHAPMAAMVSGKPLKNYHIADAVHIPGDSMGGMMVAVSVKPAPGDAPIAAAKPRHHLWLDVAKTADAGPKGLTGTFSYTERDENTPVAATGRLGPLMVLTAGEPTAVTITNHLDEPTSVHWHGIEVQDSRNDGAAMMAGMSPVIGFGPPIEPGGTFVATFTPPRAGTFMYHTHMDDIWQLVGGLAGPLVVMPPGEHFNPATDHVVMLTVDDEHSGGDAVRVNGMLAPPPLVVHRGQPQRIRLLNLTLVNSDLVVSLDGAPGQQWTPIAKDGFAMDPRLQIARTPTQEITIGETRDFSYVPSAVGKTTLDVFEEGTKVAALPIDVEP